MEAVADTHRIAVIDIGTVTVRLLAADVCGPSIAELARKNDIVQLGEGVDATGVISTAALERLDAVLARYRALLDDLAKSAPVEDVFTLATSAARDARNAADLEALLARHGFALQVIAGQTEAALTFSGMVSAFPGTAVLASDVGGGSTELIFGDAPAGSEPAIAFARSVNVGARRVTERFCTSDPPSPADLAAASAWACMQLAPAFEALPAKPARLVATAGTATTLVAVRDALDPYSDERVHGKVLTLEDVEELIALMSAVDEAHRAQIPGLQAQRAGVILGGAIVQSAVIAHSGLGECTVSTQSLLEGALRSRWRALEATQ